MVRLQIVKLLLLVMIAGLSNTYSSYAKPNLVAVQDTCSPISILPCNALKVNLPFNLNFNAGVASSISDKNGLGTGFTTVNTYSGTRLPTDGAPAVAAVPGYAPANITITGGRLQLVSNKGIDYQSNNNQLNVLGVQLARPGKLLAEVKIINPYVGTQSQQAGLWFGINDKTYIKLSTTGGKIELRKESNDVTSTTAGTANPDQRVTGVISNLNTKTVYLRLVVDFTTNKIEGFYSTDGISYINTGNGYANKSLDLSSLNITDAFVYAGVYASHRNGTSAVTYNFDDFAVADLSPPATVESFSLSANKINFTALKGQPVLPKTVKVVATPFMPAYTVTQSTAEWLTHPQPVGDSLVFNAASINTNIPAGNYQAVVTFTPAASVPPVTLLVNLNVIEPLSAQPIKVNFQDVSTIPPINYVRDYGQPFGPRSDTQQGAGLEFGWKKRLDGMPLNLTLNGRNRNYPEDILLATLMHMQANNITGTFPGTKTEGFWEIKVPNGTYDVSVTAGDGAVGTATEIHNVNVEGVSAISGFMPSGKQGSIGRFKSATVRVHVTDEYLTINADGGTNTKINSVGIVAVSTDPYLFWEHATQNVVRKKGSTQTDLFNVTLGSSDNSASSYNITTTYIQGTNGWLGFTATPAGSQRMVKFKYNQGIDLSPGIYKAIVTAKTGQYTSANFTIQLNVVDSLKPYVVSSSPISGASKVSLSTSSIAANNLHIPVVAGYPGGVDNGTITNQNVKLFKIVNNTATEVAGIVQGTGGGDAISFSPSAGLEANTMYKFIVTAGVKSHAGLEFNPYESVFTTDVATIDPSAFLNAQFTKQAIPGTQNKKYTSLAIGPDDKLYALKLEGDIERFAIDHNTGVLSFEKNINTLKNKYGNRSAIGLAFDPGATVQNMILWVSHSSGGLASAPSFDGNISKLYGDSLQSEQLVVSKLPRSTKDHLVNSIAFGPDGALYISQGSNSSAGVYDNDWMRDESLLAGAVLRLDINKLNSITLPLNVQTTANINTINQAPSTAATMGDGTYNPYGSNAALTIFASGVRNAYDLVWHSNGQLYVPTNGSGGGGNSPASVNGTRRPDGSFYNGPAVPATNGVKVQHDWLFRVNPNKPIGYYGHPNPLRGEYVINRGFEDNPLYLPSIAADNNYRLGYDFGLNNSPNGVIEYRNNAFGGVLKGKLMVCRFSGGGDIIVMEPGSMIKTNNIGDDSIYDIIKVNTGSGNSGLQGMSAFANPLDMVEDTVSGNIYVSEFNWNDNPNLTSQITLLKVHEAPLAPLAKMQLTANNDVDVNETAENKSVFTLTNSGDADLKVKSIALMGRDASKLKVVDVPLPSAEKPLVLAKNSSVLFKVIADTSLTKKDITASVRVISVDDTIKEATVKKHLSHPLASSKLNNAVTVSNVFNTDNHNMLVYPNPFTGGQINVSLKQFKKKEAVNIYLYNMAGRVQRTISGVTDEQGELSTQFPLSQPGQGTFYIVRVVYQGGSKYAKILSGN